MPRGLEKLEHIVVLMMENRSFDHMLGGVPSENSVLIESIEFNDGRL